MQKGNLPGSTTRNTKGVKYIKSYVKKVNEKEYYIAEGAVVPERSKKNKHTVSTKLLRTMKT